MQVVEILQKTLRKAFDMQMQVSYLGDKQTRERGVVGVVDVLVEGTYVSGRTERNR